MVWQNYYRENPVYKPQRLKEKVTQRQDSNMHSNDYGQ